MTSSTSRRLDRVSNAVLGIAAGWLALLFAIELLLTWGVGKWGAILLIGAVLCAGGLLLGSQHKINLALVVGSLGCSLYAAELALFVRNREVIEGMSAAQVVELLRGQGVDAYPVAPPAAYIESDGVVREGRRIFPLSGVARKTTVYCRESGRYVIYRSDRHGFNNEDDVYETSADVVLIGDSFAHGACVQPKENLGGRMRELGWKVLNLGYAGNGPLLELGTLVEYASAMRPRTVLWLYFEGNDIQNLESERRSRTLLGYLQAGFTQRLIVRQSEITPLVANFIDEGQKSRPALVRALDSRTGLILRLLNLRYLVTTTLWAIPTFGAVAYPDEEAGVFAVFEETVRQAQRVARSWGGQLYFVYLPDSLRYRSGVDHARLHRRSKVLSSVRSMQIPVVDFHETVLALTDPTAVYSYVGAHFSPAGYALLARTISESLKRKAAQAPFATPSPLTRSCAAPGSPSRCGTL